MIFASRHCEVLHPNQLSRLLKWWLLGISVVWKTSAVCHLQAASEALDMLERLHPQSVWCEASWCEKRVPGWERSRAWAERCAHRFWCDLVFASSALNLSKNTLCKSHHGWTLWVSAILAPPWVAQAVCHSYFPCDGEGKQIPTESGSTPHFMRHSLSWLASVKNLGWPTGICRCKRRLKSFCLV